LIFNIVPVRTSIHSGDTVPRSPDVAFPSLIVSFAQAIVCKWGNCNLNALPLLWLWNCMRKLGIVSRNCAGL
jgi:hypothetical protein